MGVLPIWRTKSNASASVASSVCLPMMISTSGILSTGEKKCRPMNCVGRTLAAARLVMGSVEVLDAKTASEASRLSVLRVTSALTARSSNTASMTRSQPARSSNCTVGVMRASVASRCCCVALPLRWALSSRSCEYCRPRTALSGEVSSSATSMPAFAAT